MWMPICFGIFCWRDSLCCIGLPLLCCQRCWFYFWALCSVCSINLFVCSLTNTTLLDYGCFTVSPDVGRVSLQLCSSSRLYGQFWVFSSPHKPNHVSYTIWFNLSIQSLELGCWLPHNNFLGLWFQLHWIYRASWKELTSLFFLLFPCLVLVLRSWWPHEINFIQSVPSSSIFWEKIVLDLLFWLKYSLQCSCSFCCTANWPSYPRPLGLEHNVK